MLRRARWLILLAIVAILGSVTSIFITQKRALRRNRPHASAPLPANISATAQKWEYEMTSGDQAKIILRAEHFEQVKNPDVFRLDGLEMEIHDRKGKRYNLVKSALATLDQQNGLMYSEGDVEITMHVPEENQPPGRIIKIRTSGATFEVKTARVSSERHVDFETDMGRGECLGAIYDPTNHELLMKSQVKLDWHSADPKRAPMHLETGHLTYREAASEIYLTPEASLTREGFRLNSASAVVVLNKGAIERVEAAKASGSDEMPARKLNYAADHLVMHFTPKGEVTKIDASDNARLESTSASGVMRSSAKHYDLEFEPPAEGSRDGSTLRRALGSGQARVESVAAARAGAPPQGPRLLSSEIIELRMRPGGQEMERVVTHAPGVMVFEPARKGDRHRTLTGDRMRIDYAAGNAVEKFHTNNAVSRSEAEPKDPKDPKAKPLLTITRSRELDALFDPKSGQMTRLDQTGDFRYEEGTRQATAQHAVLDSLRDLITLSPQARMWDDTGSTAADEIIIEQTSGDMIARGNVTSTRLPDKKDSGSGMLSAGEALQGRSAALTVTERNRKLHYQGNAVLWQAASRLQADNIRIDRGERTLEATGNVVSELPDERGQGGEARKPAKTARTFSIVKAPSLVYTDASKMAYYTGGVTLDRPALNMKSRQLRAWFTDQPKADGGSQTRLSRLFADGAVDIFERSPQRTRSGNSEHAEYYPDDERMVLNGGSPVVVDSKRGTSRGAEITWYSRQDRLTVDNSGAGPAVSRINNSKGQGK